jgi:hypothetical protein
MQPLGTTLTTTKTPEPNSCIQEERRVKFNFGLMVKGLTLPKDLRRRGTFGGPQKKKKKKKIFCRSLKCRTKKWRNCKHDNVESAELAYPITTLHTRNPIFLGFHLKWAPYLGGCPKGGGVIN